MGLVQEERRGAQEAPSGHSRARQVPFWGWRGGRIVSFFGRHLGVAEEDFILLEHRVPSYSLPWSLFK